MARTAQNIVQNEAPEGAAVARIVEAARRHFFAHGFRSVTMDDLADELGMSKKTLYANFPSKTSLIKSVLLQKIGDVDRDLAALTAAEGAGFADSLERVLRCVQGHIEEIHPPFLRDMQRDAPELFQLVEAKRQEIIQQHFGRLLSEGRRSGLVRKDVPVRMLIEILLAAVQGIVNPAKLLSLGSTPREAYGSIMTVLLHGMLERREEVRT